MKTFLLSILFLLVFYQHAFTQTIHGTVTNKANDQPIALANLGILNSKTGTYTADNGSFSINILDDLVNPVLVISAIGFEAKHIQLDNVDTGKDLNITLTPKEYELGSFTVKSSRIKTKTIGNKRIPKLNMAYTSDFLNTRFGRTIAIKIEPKHDPPYRIDELSIGIYENPWEKTRYRCRFVSIDSETGEPGEDLTSISEIVEFKEKDGWLHFTFDDEKPFISNQQFFLLVENIDDTGEKRAPEKLASPAPIYMFNAFSLSKQDVYLSDEGLQQWEKKNKDPTFRLTYAYE